jgi:hypothetical protein
MKWIGAAGLAVALLFAGADRIESASALPLQLAVQASQASRVSDKPTDVSARRRDHRYGYRRYHRPYDPYYYGRPYYYAPAPFFPLPPFFGYGWPW